MCSGRGCQYAPCTRIYPISHQPPLSSDRSAVSRLLFTPLTSHPPVCHPWHPLAEAAHNSNVLHHFLFMRNLRVCGRLPYVAGVLAVLLLPFFFYLYNADIHSLHSVAFPLPKTREDPHPIVDLLRSADVEFKKLLATETSSLSAAAKRYRERRGRHPPPGFDKWWEYAKENNATIIEEFWDPIYHDLRPLWALGQKGMLSHVRAQPSLFRVRNGNITHEGDHFWMPIWEELFSSVAKDLPDMDIAVNSMDEPRLLVSWEDINAYVKTELSERSILPVGWVRAEYSGISTRLL
jgi:hypothetical protein